MEEIPYFEGTLFFSVLVYIFETYLEYRQFQKLKEKKRPAQLTDEIVTVDKFLESQAYGYDKSKFGFINDFFSLAIDLLTWVFFLPVYFWNLSGSITAHFGYGPEYEITQSLVLVVIAYVLNTVIKLPFSLYSTFVIEQKHGFNKQTYRLFFTDLAKSTVLFVLLACPIMAGFIYIVKWGGEHFYIFVWLFLLVVQFAAMWIYPTLIQPCFNTVKPIEDGPLRQQIELLAQSVQYPLKKLFEIDGSTRSSHSNAYLFGFCGNKRIVLYDTLIQQNTPEEIVAVVGHELGHWKLSHTIKMLVIGQVHSLVMLWLFGFMLHSEALFSSFGFTSQRPVLIGFALFELVWSPLSHVLSFAMNLLSRFHEFQADAFAQELGYGKHLKSALIKLSKENKSNYNPDVWYSTYHYSHPPLIERLRAIDALENFKLAKKVD